MNLAADVVPVKSLRELILARALPAPVPVEVPEWGLTVHLKPPSLADWVRFLSVRDDEAEATLAALLPCVCDEAGRPVFAESDRDELLKLHGPILQRLARRVVADARATFDQVDAIAKN